MDKVGFLLFLLGAGGMDSPDVTVPAVMVVGGLAIIGLSAIKEAFHPKADQSHVKSSKQ